MTTAQAEPGKPTAAHAYGISLALWLLAVSLLVAAITTGSWLLVFAGVAFATAAASWFDTGDTRRRRRDRHASYDSPNLVGSHRT